MKNQSIWKESVKNESLPGLDKDIACDILIIGGGIAGLSTAYFLKDTDMNVVLMEKINAQKVLVQKILEN